MTERRSASGATPVFFHVPKTAGRTLIRIFRRQYGRDRVFEAYWPTADEALERYRGLPESEKRAYDAVVGHVPIDIHEMIPGPSVYVTFVRDPVDRVLSEYFYVRRSPDHPLHDTIVENDMSLPELLRSGLMPMLENGQTRSLAKWWEAYGACPPELVERAMENLERHVVVAGLVERFDESILLMADELGWSWRNMFYVPRNVGSRRPRARELPEETVALVETFNEVDIELYRRVKEAVRRRADAAGAGFRTKRSAFAGLNRAYGRGRGLKNRIARAVSVLVPVGAALP